MANARYLYEVAVDTGSTLRAAQNVRNIFQREMATINTSFSGAAGRLAGSTGGGLTSALGGLLPRGLSSALGGGLAGGVAGVLAGITVQSAGQMALYAKTIQNAESALEAFSGSAAAAEARIEAIQMASGGAVTKLEAMRIANQGAALGFGKTSAELARVTELASKVSTVFGGDLAGNIENMAAAAANLSFVRLDTLGISADETRKRFEELRGELGDTAAFMQAMLEIGEKTYRNIDAQASGVTRLAAAWADLKATGAGAGAPFVEGIANFGADSLRGIELVIDYYRRINEAQEIFTRGMESSDPVVRAHADQIGYLGGQFATGQISMFEYMAALNQVILTLGQYEAQSRNSASATDDLAAAVDNAAKKFAYTERAQLLANNPSLQALIESGAMGTSFMTTDRAKAQPNALGDSIERERKIQDAITRQIEQAQAEQSRLAKQTAADTTSAWLRAADNVKSAWEKAVGGVSGIPGVTGRSEVTALDMRLAEYGLYQNKPDEFLRQVEDQLLNGVDRGISRNLLTTLTAQSTGFDLGKVNALPNDLLAQLFGQEYTSGRLFSTPLGQGLAPRLFDTGAVGAGIDAANAAGAGSDFVKKMLGEDLPQQFATVAGEALKGLRDGLTGSEDLPKIGAESAQTILAEFKNTMTTSPEVSAAATALIAEFFRQYQQALTGGQ